MGLESLGVANHRNGTGACFSLTGYLTTEVVAFRNGQEVEEDPDYQRGSTQKDMTMVESIARKVVGELAFAGLVVVGVVELVFRAALALFVVLVVFPLSLCLAEEPAVVPLMMTVGPVIGHACSLAMTVAALFENVRLGIQGEELVYDTMFPLAQTMWHPVGNFYDNN
jgi:hypothetical protein